jgi:glycosyltransferase involved in cell wall biosynthesis
MYFNSTKPGRYEYVFMPGRLHVWKRIDLMIKAMQYVKEPVSLIISGTGEDRIRLEIMAAFDGRIKFTGYISDREQADLYANALVVAFVPVREDFGYITLEAFAHEKPVITCTDSGEPLQFVEDGISGFVVEPDPKEIAVKIEHLLQNPAIAEKMGKQGRSKIEHLLNWSEISEKIISTLQNTNA